jgi:hypothetical protein
MPANIHCAFCGVPIEVFTKVFACEVKNDPWNVKGKRAELMFPICVECWDKHDENGLRKVISEVIRDPHTK